MDANLCKFGQNNHTADVECVGETAVALQRHIAGGSGAQIEWSKRARSSGVGGDAQF